MLGRPGQRIAGQSSRAASSAEIGAGAKRSPSKLAFSASTVSPHSRTTTLSTSARGVSEPIAQAWELRRRSAS